MIEGSGDREPALQKHNSLCSNPSPTKKKKRNYFLTGVWRLQLSITTATLPAHFLQFVFQVVLCFCSSWPRTTILLPLSPRPNQVARIIILYHHTWLCLWKDLPNYLTELASNCISLISASQVTRIVDMSHHAWLRKWNFVLSSRLIKYSWPGTRECMHHFLSCPLFLIHGYSTPRS
jgi:hypothetical protein